MKVNPEFDEPVVKLSLTHTTAIVSNSDVTPGFLNCCWEGPLLADWGNTYAAAIDLSFSLTLFVENENWVPCD